MKPTELRIGNLVLYEGKVVKVEQITKKKIGFHRYEGETRMNYARLQEVEPILITKELLQMNGFCEIQKETYGELCGLVWNEYRKEIEGVIIDIDIKHKQPHEYIKVHIFNKTLNTIKKRELYVHDLQNAYNLVTKQELTLHLCNEKS